MFHFIHKLSPIETMLYFALLYHLNSTFSLSEESLIVSLIGCSARSLYPLHSAVWLLIFSGLRRNLKQCGQLGLVEIGLEVFNDLFLFRFCLLIFALISSIFSTSVEEKVGLLSNLGTIFSLLTKWSSSSRFFPLPLSPDYGPHTHPSGCSTVIEN